MPRRIFPIVVLAAAGLLAGRPDARADPAPRPTLPTLPTRASAWSSAFPDVAARVRASKTLLLQVAVPLCSNEQIHCGEAWAGNPGGLATNLYWGAMFGARRFFERPSGGWERIDVAPRAAPMLEQVVFRRRIAGATWGVEGSVETLVALQAFHGAQIDEAVNALWHTALAGGEVTFRDGGRDRREPVSISAYAGHNRLMDGLHLPPVPVSARPIPSFVLACMSESYFGEPLRKAGSWPLVTSRAYMAPEGYVVDAVARAIAENLPVEAIRSAAVDATAQWQKIARSQADAVFALSALRGPG